MNNTRNPTYIYQNDFNDYIIHDTEIGHDYHISEFDIRRNINIQKYTTGEPYFYNAHLVKNKIVLDEVT